MSQDSQKQLLKIAKDIVIVTDGKGDKKLNDSVIVVTGKILELSIEDFRLLRDWFKEKTGCEFEIPKKSIEVRELLRDLLVSNKISVPELPKYEMQQSNFKSSSDFLKEWGSDDVFSSKRRR